MNERRFYINSDDVVFYWDGEFVYFIENIFAGPSLNFKLFEDFDTNGAEPIDPEDDRVDNLLWKLLDKFGVLYNEGAENEA